MSISLAGKVGKLKILSSIIIAKQDKIRFETEFDFDLVFRLSPSTPEFNVCIGNVLSLVSLTIATPNAIKDEALFKEWVLATLDISCSFYFCLSDQRISLKDVFKGRLNHLNKKSMDYILKERVFINTLNNPFA